MKPTLETIIRICNEETQAVMTEAIARIRERAAKECPDAKFRHYNPTILMQQNTMERLTQETMQVDIGICVGTINFNAQDLVSASDDTFGNKTRKPKS